MRRAQLADVNEATTVKTRYRGLSRFCGWPVDEEELAAAPGRHRRGQPVVPRALRVGRALIEAKRERHRTALLLEADAMNHNGPGTFLGNA